MDKNDNQVSSINENQSNSCLEWCVVCGVVVMCPDKENAASQQKSFNQSFTDKSVIVPSII